MNWEAGFTATYHACVVDPVTWKDCGRIEIDSGSINRTGTGLRESADLSCTDYSKGSDIWLRVYLDAIQPGDSEHIPLFTGLVSTPEDEIDDAYADCSLQCYSVLVPAQEVLLPRGWYALKGQSGAALVADLLAVSPAPVTIEGESPLLSQHIVAEQGENRLTMIDKILDAINWRIRISGDGSITICPKPTKISATFSSLKYDLILPPVKRRADRFSCPNVLRAVTGDTAVTVRDDSEGSALSTVSRGREVWTEEADVQLGDGESLRAYAERRLKELQSVSLVLEYDRLFLPDICVTDKIRLQYPAQNLSGIFVIESQNIDLDHSCTTGEDVSQVE